MKIYFYLQFQIVFFQKDNILLFKNTWIFLKLNLFTFGCIFGFPFVAILFLGVILIKCNAFFTFYFIFLLVQKVSTFLTLELG